MKAAATIAQGELIGLSTTVVKSNDPSQVGIAGQVIKETRNTLVIKQANQDRVIVKNVAVFQFSLLDGTVVEVEGNAIVGRPENRIKKKPARQW